MWRYGSCLIPLWLVVSCGTGDPVAEGEPNPFGPTGIPPALRGAGSQGGTPLAPGGITEAMRNNPGVVLDQDEIVYTDPDAEDPENIPTELSLLLSEEPQEGPWGQSYTEAFKQAKRKEKPVLIWFTDSQNSVNCKMMNQELFNDGKFDEWASDSFVRLRVDSRVSGDTGDEIARKRDYVEGLKKRYKVHGTPLLVVLTPAGDVIGRYKGYLRGQASYKWGQLRQASVLADDKHRKWKARMEKKGYRTWKDPRGRKIFAKLESCWEGKVVLVEPDGTRARTKERNLSPNDQDWLAAQRRARGIE